MAAKLIHQALPVGKHHREARHEEEALAPAHLIAQSSSIVYGAGVDCWAPYRRSAKTEKKIQLLNYPPAPSKTKLSANLEDVTDVEQDVPDQGEDLVQRGKCLAREGTRSQTGQRRIARSF